jgi:hypothetical protein
MITLLLLALIQIFEQTAGLPYCLLKNQIYKQVTILINLNILLNSLTSFSYFERLIMPKMIAPNEANPLVKPTISVADKPRLSDFLGT